MKRGNDISELIKATYTAPAVSCELERKIMLKVAQRAIANSQRRARFGLVASLSGITVAAAACIAGVVLWFPTRILLSIDINAVFDNVISSIRALL
jgi:hypothetical protein